MHEPRSAGGPGSRAALGDAAVYEIVVSGRLDPAWADWFDCLGVTARSNGETNLTVLVPDQAALHGLLARIRDLGLPLLCVKREGWVESPPAAED